VVNYPGEGFLHMTKAEWAKINKDYKATRPAKMEGFGPFRVRTTIDHKTHSTVRVFITDEKIKVLPVLVEKVALVPATMEAPEKLVEPFMNPDRSIIEERRNKAKALKEADKAGIQVVSANQLFPTPVELAERMVDEACIKPGMSILEPSAGTGRILDAIADCYLESVEVTAVEINHNLANALSNRVGVEAICTDFMEFKRLWSFDRVLMNPPFENGTASRMIFRCIGPQKN